MKNNPQWKKRVDLFIFTYISLISSLSDEQIRKEAFEIYDFNEEQMTNIEIYLANKKKFIEIVTQNLTAGWSWDRISFIDKAVLLSAMTESESKKTDKSVIIDQAVITCKKYSDSDSFKFINAILQKVI